MVLTQGKDHGVSSAYRLLCPPLGIHVTWIKGSLHVPRSGHHRTWSKSLSVMKACAVWPHPLCICFLVVMTQESGIMDLCQISSSHLAIPIYSERKSPESNAQNVTCVDFSEWQVILVFTLK